MTPLDALIGAFTERRLSDAIGAFAESATYQESGRAPMAGKAAIKAYFERFAASGLDWSFTADAVLRDGNRACVVFRYAANEGAGRNSRERAGCAVIDLDSNGFIEAWREYEG